MLSVYDYFDYRKFINDSYKARKAEDSRFSYRYIGSKVGFTSAGFFTKILQGKTNISMKTALAFCSLFKLTKQETHYFETLVQFNQSGTHESRRFFFERLLSLKQSVGRDLVPEQYELFSNWYTVVIREMINYFPLTDNFRELAGAIIPSIKESEAKKAVILLSKLGLITKNPDGFYEQTDRLLTTGSEWTSLAIDKFQIDTAVLAGEAISTLPKEQRDISTCTLSISEKTFEAIRERTKQFRKELLELARADSVADRTYHLNVHLFPVSKSYREHR